MSLEILLCVTVESKLVFFKEYENKKVFFSTCLVSFFAHADVNIFVILLSVAEDEENPRGRGI